MYWIHRPPPTPYNLPAFHPYEEIKKKKKGKEQTQILHYSCVDIWQEYVRLGYLVWTPVVMVGWIGVDVLITAAEGWT